MCENMNILSVNDIVRIKKSSKDGRPISYACDGRVILFKNWDKLHFGFGRITSITEKKNCFVVTAENCAWDFYYGYSNDEVIPLSEFEEVLTKLGFTKQYTSAIDDNNNFYVWARLETGELLTIETWNRDGEVTYNSVVMSIPVDGLISYGMWDRLGFSHGNGNVVSCDIIHCKESFPIIQLLRCSSKSRNWKGETPSLWHYGDGHEFSFSEVLKRIYDFKDDVATLFNMDVEGTLKAYAESEMLRA